MCGGNRSVQSATFARTPAAGLGRVACIVLLTAAGLSTGCVNSLRDWAHNGFKVGPEYCKPVAPVQSHWIDYRKDVRLAEGPIDTSAWWRVFNDPKLDALMHNAVCQNLSLRVAARGFCKPRPCEASRSGTSSRRPSRPRAAINDWPAARTSPALFLRSSSTSSTPGSTSPGSWTSGGFSVAAWKRRTPTWTPRSRVTTARWCCCWRKRPRAMCSCAPPRSRCGWRWRTSSGRKKPCKRRKNALRRRPSPRSACCRSKTLWRSPKPFSTRPGITPGWPTTPSACCWGFLYAT